MQETWPQVIAFASCGRIGLIDVDGRNERYLHFEVPGQASWQLGPAFSDGRRLIVQSLEDLTTARLVVGDVRTRIWIDDLVHQNLVEIMTQGRPAIFWVSSHLARRSAGRGDRDHPWRAAARTHRLS